MNKTITLGAALIFTSLMISCKKEATTETPKEETKTFSQMEKVNWFLGRWENNSQEGNLSEIWKKANDSTFLGESYFDIKGDTVFAEHVNLEERGGKLFYIARVPNQNDEKPVSFELTKSTDTQLTFENPSHDYPNTIIYNQVGKDSLVAEIRGMKDGKAKNEFFKMKKVN